MGLHDDPTPDSKSRVEPIPVLFGVLLLQYLSSKSARTSTRVETETTVVVPPWGRNDPLAVLGDLVQAPEFYVLRGGHYLVAVV